MIILKVLPIHDHIWMLLDFSITLPNFANACFHQLLFPMIRITFSTFLNVSKNKNLRIISTTRLKYSRNDS